MITYLIDKNHSNSCGYNKKTEEIQTDTPCGNNGIVDKLVMQAKSETQEKALFEAVTYLKYKGYLQSQIDIIAEQLRNCFQISRGSIFKDCISPSIESICSQIMSLGSYPPDCTVFEQDVIECNNVYHNTYDNLFFSGNHTSFSGQAINVPMWIDKINNDPNISLEGSKQTKQINIINGSCQETLFLQPYSVALVEIIMP